MSGAIGTAIGASAMRSRHSPRVAVTSSPASSLTLPCRVQILSSSRLGFADMLRPIAGNGVRTIIVETANRFARDLMVQEVGFAKLRELGIELVAADSPNAFLDVGPTSKLIRQVLGAVAEFDKAMTVAKLRGARERKRRERGKCEGRKSHAEARPEVVREAKRP